MVARPSGFLRELDVGALLDQRKHLALDELRVGARHRVVFAAALAALGVLAAIADLDRDHRRHAALRDQVVERGGEVLVGGRAAVADHDERRLRAAHILRRDIDVDRARPGAGMAGGHDHVRLVARRRHRHHDRAVVAARRIVADQAGVVDHAVLRRQREGRDRAARHAVLGRGLGGGRVGRADDEIPLGAGRRQRAVGKLRRARIVRVRRVARRRRGLEIESRRVDEERRRLVAGVGAGGNGHVLGDAGRLGVRRGARYEPHGRHQRPREDGQ